MRTTTVLAVALTLVLALNLRAQELAPALTEVEALKLETLKLRTALAQAQAHTDSCRAEVGALFQVLGQLRADKASVELTAEERALKALIEQNHPGYTFNPKTGALTKAGGA